MAAFDGDRGASGIGGGRESNHQHSTLDQVLGH
jgi:hypothetical protein